MFVCVCVFRYTIHRRLNDSSVQLTIVSFLSFLQKVSVFLCLCVCEGRGRGCLCGCLDNPGLWVREGM